MDIILYGNKADCQKQWFVFLCLSKEQKLKMELTL